MLFSNPRYQIGGELRLPSMRLPAGPSRKGIPPAAAWSGGSSTGPQAEHPESGESAEAAHGTILVVDDDPSILSTIREVLEFEQYRVELARDGAEALLLLERSTPRLILLDMNMPLVNGWEVARILRERGSSIPIVVMTAAHDARRLALEVHAQGYVAKPFDLIELLDVVERLYS